MGATVSRSDFEWVYTEEPHATRRKEMLAKYPQIKKLMGYEPRTKYVVTVMVAIQFIVTYLIADASWVSIIFLAYCFGGTINHSLMLAIHEIAHNLAFGHSRPLANRAFGIFANFPIGVPYSISFKKYHLDHHRYQGHEKYDVDIPSEWEGKFFRHTLTKLIWVMIMPFVYTIRPLLMNPKRITSLELISVVIIFSFDYLVYNVLGAKALFYLVGGSFMATGLHPMSGHFISEHYMFQKGIETYSYYGPLNILTFNVGYHNEHHDFPSIPGSRLPQVKKIAPEYYENLPSYTSWVSVIYNFITDPEVGTFSRVRRRAKSFENGNGSLHKD